jgi:Zn finger protein HypA/HybF involved in hydrogenase expression
MLFHATCTNDECDYEDDECPIPVRTCPACGSKTVVLRNGEEV